MKLPEKFAEIVITSPTGFISLSPEAKAINQLIDYLAEREAQPTYTTSGLVHSEPIVIKQTITLPKPKWWEKNKGTLSAEAYEEALEAASKASGINFELI